MKRRIYFLIPDADHTRAIVNKLEASGINIAAMHVLAKPEIDLSGLPVATGRQRTDTGARIETILWDGNLTLYFIALFTLILLIYIGLEWYWLLLPVAVMVATFVLGIIFTSKVPNVHLSEFRDAMHHGELLLMVDTPLWRVQGIEKLVCEHHPEVTIGGVGWHIDALKI